MSDGDEVPGRDIHFLVELAPDARPFEILSVGAELQEALAVKVDVGTPDSLKEHLRGGGPSRRPSSLSV